MAVGIVTTSSETAFTYPPRENSADRLARGAPGANSSFDGIGRSSSTGWCWSCNTT
jgi:hypothetical protein